MANKRQTSERKQAELVEGPTDLTRGDWWRAVKRAGREFLDDKLTIWAAALTYYGVLSLFPFLIALTSLLGLIGPSVTQPMLDNVAQLSPGPARDIATQAIENVQANRTGSGIALVGALAVAIWSASGYITTFTQAANSVWDVEEGRPFWKTIPISLALTVLMLVLLVISAVLVVFTGPLAQELGDVVGVGSTVVTVWEIAKWPVLLFVFALMAATLYYTTPNIRHPGFRWITPGSLLAILLWLLASGGFALYVATLGSYNKTYGSMAAPIIFLVWLWLSNIALLFGAELDSELERGKQIKAGHPSTEEPFLEPKEAKKSDDNSE